MLSFRQIEAFRATLEAGSVSAASRLLHISQPSLSRLIADLETEVGFSLFIRERRGMKPTEEARLFYRDVERSYLGLRELESSAREIKGFGRSRFAFGAAPGVALEFVPKVISAFNRRYGPVQIETHVSTSDRILDDTRSGRVSLAIITPNESTADVTILLERQFEYVAIMHRDHSLAMSRQPLAIDAIDYGDLISPPANFLAARCRDQRVAARIGERSKITIDVSFTAIAMARQQLGIALVDPFSAAFAAPDESLVSRRLVDAPRYPFTLAQPRRLIASELQTAFIEEIERELASFERRFGGPVATRGGTRR